MCTVPSGLMLPVSPKGCWRPKLGIAGTARVVSIHKAKGNGPFCMPRATGWVSVVLGFNAVALPTCPHLQRLSGISSRLLLAAMNSSRLASLPMPEGSPSKSRWLEFRYSFFSLVSLQMADWRESRQGGVRAAAKVAQ